ncbi:INO80 complex subunit D [Penaeus vannamei]|uniref:INO80 complex subunit D n=1 Tax=Penaeus vannamei TaxID=6689 RepID=A0A423TDD8_PENVA|nr:INO80 complex subunit D [Penaeus vannamei]
MMSESARLPPLLSPAWNPPNITSSSVGAGRRGAGKRAREAGIHNGHHAQPRPNCQPSQQDSAAHVQDSTRCLSPPHPLHQASDHQSSPQPSQTQSPLRDMPKTPVTTSKSLSGTLPTSPSSTSASGTFTSPTSQSKGRDRWGGWLGGSLSSQRGRTEATRHRANSSPLQSSEPRAFDMTKLYPELSAKLGLTKPNCSDSTNSHKNGITQREHFTSGPLSKSESAMDDSRIKQLGSTASSHGILPHPKSSQASLARPGSLARPFSISSTASPSRSLVTSPATYPPSVAAHQPRVVTLPPRRPPQPTITRAASATLPEPLLRVHSLREKYYAYNSDLFPLGVETSEESDSSDTDDMCGSQQGWVDPTDSLCLARRGWDSLGGDSSSRQQEWLDPSGTTPAWSSKSTSCQRSNTIAAALASYRRQVVASRLRSNQRAWEALKQCPLTKSLVEAARTHPRLAANACCLFRNSQNEHESPKMKSRFKSSVLIRRDCAYDDGGGSGPCGDASLPGTRHCIRHIMYNVDQQLFTHCTARHSDNTPCRIPVFDVCHELPLCPQHSMRESCKKSCVEETPKPKRSRKKNKMPILSRYGKRSKKRRRSSNSTSSVIPSTSVRPPMASQSSLSSPQPSPTTPQTSPHFSAASCTDSVAEAEASDLEDDMEGMVEGLDAASRLLDPHDLQDVLNRIPDHELTQLFDAPESKTGEFVVASEEKVELETDHGEEDEVTADSPPPSSSPAAATPAAASATTTSPTPPLVEEGTTLSLDESTLNDLVAGNIPIDSIISSSFNQQELNTISQALSNIVQENNINLAGFDLNAGNSFSASETGGSGPVGDVSDSSLMSQASDATNHTDFCEAGPPLPECKINILNQRPGIITDTATLSPLK